MLSNLFINVTILVSFIFLASQVLKEGDKFFSSLLGKLLIALFGSVIGVTLMHYSIRVHNNTFVDLRFIPIVLLAFYASSFSTLISAALISISRIAFYGLNESSLLGACATMVIAIGCCLIMRSKIKRHLKYIFMFLYSLTIVVLTLIILLSGEVKFGVLIANYSVIYIISAIIVYRLSEYIANSAKLYNQFKEQATKDFLTGLNNVRQYDSAINEAFKRVQQYDEKLSILALDIDHFKIVNDTFGHDGGDVVLKQFGALLLKSCRPFDIVARVGGEEFSVILLDCPNLQAIEVAERIRKSVSKNLFMLPNGETIKISVSIGVATYPGTTLMLEEIKKQADLELYKAKESGRNKVCSYPNKECYYCDSDS
jgi:diguanylate cyclase